MHGTGPNPALIRGVFIVLIVLISQILRMAKKSKASNPAAGGGGGKGSPLEVLRQVKRQASNPARGPRSELPVQGEPMAVAEPLRFEEQQPFQQVQQPPTIGPESSLIPSLLLLALLACLCVMAYRYWAG
jgi:hypothetical protein